MPAKQLGLAGAVAIGLASMLGAGVFGVFSEAYQVSQSGIFIALGLAALVASLNAASVYSLASQIERPGGIYAYSRKLLSDSTSFIAGTAFVVGKIGSIAAISLVFANYVAQSSLAISVSVIWALALINILGINRTALVASILAVTVTIFLISVVGYSLVDSDFSASVAASSSSTAIKDFPAIFQAASLLFFAFAGYARVATLGDEVKNSKLNIPRAILISLVSVVLLYFALCYVLVGTLGANLANSSAPILDLAASSFSWMSPQLIGFVASLACLGSMLALLAGVSRTAATMAEDSELPTWFSARNKLGSPWRAELAIATAATILVLAFQDLSQTVGISSLFVLIYYAIGHLSAIRQVSAQRKVPVGVALLGLLLCATLAATVNPVSLVSGLVILAMAVGWRKLAHR